MGSKNKALFLEVVCLAMLSLTCIVVPLDCPSIIFIEPSQDALIDCKILAGHDVYWYKGRIPGSDLIAKVEGGNVEIIEDKQHYDLNEYGSLIVKDVTDELYGFYSVLDYHPDYTHDTGIIELRFAVKPPTDCPIFSSCMKCHGCNLTERSSGDLSCSITRTRPKVHIKVFVEYNHGYSVVIKKPETIHDPLTDTWNTTSTVEYEANSCDSSILVRCVAKDGHPFNLSESFVNVQSDPCVTTVKDSTFPAYGICIIIAVFVFGVLGLTFLLRRKVLSSSQNESNEDDEMFHLLKKDDLQNDFFKSLVAHLMAEYASLCSFKCLLKGFSLSSEALFNGDIFSLKTMNNAETVTSGANLTQKLFEEAGRYVLITNENHSKKLLIRYFCSWLSDDIPNRRIILYLSLDGLNSKMRVADAIVKKLNMQNKFSVGEMQKVIQNHRCLIVMDEINKLISQKGTQDTECKENLELTIDDLLKNKDVFNHFPNLGCLASFKSTTNLQHTFAKPYTILKLRHLNSASSNLYIRNVFRYYAKARAVVDGQFDLQRGVGYNYETANTVITNNSNGKEDKTVLLTTELLKETSTTNVSLKNDQIWLLLLVHVIMSEITKKTERKDLDLCFYRRSCLTKMLLNYLKIRYSSKPLEKVSFEDLEMELGKISLETKLEDAKFDDKSSLLLVHEKEEMESLIGENKFEAVLSCGLIYLIEDDTSTQGVASDENTCSSSTKNVVFCHTFVQEYLAAQAIATTKQTLESFSNSSCWQTDERMERVLQFIFATKKDARSELMKSFMEKKKWDILADCLFESESTEEYLELIATALQPSRCYAISFHKLCCYFHRLAVLFFCKTLSHIQIVPALLSFTGNCPVDFFRQLKIPRVRFLLIKEMNLQNGNDFIQILELVLAMDITFSLQCMKCDFPPEVSKDALQRLVQGNSNLPEVLRTDTIKDAPIDTFPHRGWEKLNFETGSWE